MISLTPTIKSALRQTYHKAKYQLLYLRYRYMLNFIFVHIPKTGGTSVEDLLLLPQLHDRALTQKNIWFGADEYESALVS